MAGLEAEQILLDLGCGRIFAGLSRLSTKSWESLCNRARRVGGYLQLERAPRSFREMHNLFGPRRPEWDLSHRVKEALDPMNLFAPGRLPGRR